MKPEERARQHIDTMLTEAGWIVQDRKHVNLGAGLGIAIREFSPHTGIVADLLSRCTRYFTFPLRDNQRG